LLCTEKKDIVLIRIVLKTCIGLNVGGILSNTGFHYNTDSYNILSYYTGDHRGRDCMVVGFIATCAIFAYHHYSCEFESHSWRGVLYNIMW